MCGKSTGLEQGRYLDQLAEAVRGESDGQGQHPPQIGVTDLLDENGVLGPVRAWMFAVVVGVDLEELAQVLGSSHDCRSS